MARKKSRKLIDAAHEGKTAKARELLETEDPETLAPQLSEALVGAVCTRNAELVGMLLQHDADPNTLMSDDCPVLCRATWEDPSDPAVEAIARVLLERGARLDVRGEMGLTPLLSAVLYCAKQSPAAMARARRSWADFAALLAGEELSDGGTSAQREDAVAESGPSFRFGVIDLLLERGASLDERDPVGASATLLAAMEGDAELVEALIARGASPDGVLELEMLRAAQAGRVGDLASALERGANPNQRLPLGSTALSSAVEEGHVDVVDLLLAHGADPDLAESAAPEGDFNPLFRATYAGHLDIVRRLLRAGADPRALGPGKQRLLGYAKMGSKERSKSDQPWDEIIALVREASAGAPPTVTLAPASGDPAVLAALRAAAPGLGEVGWRQAKIGAMVVYESDGLDEAPLDWDGLGAAVASHGFAPVLAAWSLDDVEPDLHSATSALAAISADTGQTLLDRLEAERRTAAEEWADEDAGDDEEDDGDPFFAIESRAPLPTPSGAAEIRLSVRRHRVVLIDGPPEAVYVLYGGGQPDLAGEELASVFAQWRRRTGAQLAAFDRSTADVVLPRALSDEASIRRLALDLYAVAPDLGENAQHLLEMAASRQWRLWWD